MWSLTFKCNDLPTGIAVAGLSHVQVLLQSCVKLCIKMYGEEETYIVVIIDGVVECLEKKSI